MKSLWFFVILSPLLGIICAPFFGISPLIPFLEVVFYILLDAGHKYFTISYFIHYSLHQNHHLNKKLIIIPLLFTLIFMLGFYFQIPYLWALFFYLVTIHFLWQIDWFFTLFQKNTPTHIRWLLQASLIFILAVVHFSPTHFIALQFQKDPLTFESLKTFNLLRNIDLVILIPTLILLSITLYKQQISKRGYAYVLSLLLLIRFIFYTPWLGGDPIFVFISIHSLPIIFFIFKRIKQLSPITALLIIVVTLLLSTIDVDFLTSYLNLDLEYLITKPTLLIAFGSASYIFIQLFHIAICYHLRLQNEFSIDTHSCAS